MTARLLGSWRKAIALAAASLFSLSIVGEGLAMPVAGTAVFQIMPQSATEIALKKKKKRKRKHGGQVKPTHSTPDSPKKNPPKPQPKDGGEKARTAIVICIDGEMVGRACRCDPGAKLMQLSRRFKRCIAPATNNNSTTMKMTARVASAAAQETGAQSAGIAFTAGSFVADEVLVGFSANRAAGSEGEITRKYNLTRLESWPINLIGQRIVRFRINGGRSVQAVLLAMQGDLAILLRQPNYLYSHLQGAAGTEPVNLQFALEKISIPKIHGFVSGKGEKLAILDSGIDQQHVELHGAVEAVFAAQNENSSPIDPHGTEVAGIVAAHAELQGIAPDVRLLDGRIFDHVLADGTWRATSLALLRGLDWAMGHKASVINMSLSGPSDKLVESAIAEAVGKGAVVVAAAGNGGTNAPASYPAAYNDVIAVTATDAVDALFTEANRGDYIDVAAPGVDILVPALADRYSMVSGTSFAAAHVSGVVALMLSRKAGMSPAEIKRKLEITATDLGEPGTDSEFGAGLINALSALQE